MMASALSVAMIFQCVNDATPERDGSSEQFNSDKKHKKRNELRN
jgi:hypothetical protein